MKQQVQIKKPSDILPLVQKWRKRREENFIAITLDGAHSVIRVHHISKGLLNRTIVHPRECYFPVIRDYSAAVIFVHNHPSGNANPSNEDNEITDRLSMAGKILGITLLDHIIITPINTFYSYKQDEKLNIEFPEYILHDFVKGLCVEVIK